MRTATPVSKVWRDLSSVSLTLCLVHEGDKSSQAEDKTEDETGEDGDVRDVREPGERSLPK